jgi:hypothetical protein
MKTDKELQTTDCQVMRDNHSNKPLRKDLILEKRLVMIRLDNQQEGLL